MLAVWAESDSALPLLLPAEEEGISNDNRRIRQSLTKLMGDMSQLHCPSQSSHSLSIVA